MNHLSSPCLIHCHFNDIDELTGFLRQLFDGTKRFVFYTDGSGNRELGQIIDPGESVRQFTKESLAEWGYRDTLTTAEVYDWAGRQLDSVLLIVKPREIYAGRPLDPDGWAPIDDEMRHANKINAIRIYRAKTGADLLPAKEAVESRLA